MNPDLQKKRNQAFTADFIILTFLAVAGEFLSQKGLERFTSDFYFSVAALPLFILLFRWGLWGVPSLLIFSIASSAILTAATAETLVVNILGYPAYALGMILFIAPGREEIRSSIHFAFLYLFAGFTGMILLRSFVLSLFEANFLSSLLLIASNEALSFIACTLFFILMRSREGYLIYLPAVYREKEAAEEKPRYSSSSRRLSP